MCEHAWKSRRPTRQERDGAYDAKRARSRRASQQHVSVKLQRLRHPHVAGLRLAAGLLGSALAARVVANLAADRARYGLGRGELSQIEPAFGAGVRRSHMLEVDCVERAAFRTLDRAFARRAAATAYRVA